MDTTTQWVIEWMQCKPQEGQYQNVVITCGWRCNGTNGTYNATVYGTCSFNQIGDPFTQYADLTEQQVLGWCWANGVDKDATEANIQTQIDNQINPPVIQPPLPWAA